MIEQPGGFFIVSFISMFSIIIGLSLIVILRQWIKNRRSPRIVSVAIILNKHIEKQYIHRKRNASPGMHTRRMQIYYVLFKLESGEKIELRVNKIQYSELRKGYKGKLTFQGTKYIGFERVKSKS